MSGRLGLLRYLRLRPFDTSTEAGRAQERHRRAALSAAASVLAKVLSVSTALISVPLTLGYLGPERYGMWITMSSLIAMLGFADLGIGNGVLTAVARAQGRDDHAAVQAYVSSGFFVLTGIAIGLLSIFAICYPLVEWHRIFNVTSELARLESAPATAVLVICFTLAIPAGIVQRVQMGLQRGFLSSLWQCAASTLALASVLLAIHLQAGLPWLVAAFAGAPLLASLVNSLLFFGRSANSVAPRLACVTRQAMREVAGAGALFLVLQVVMAITYSSDGILIAQLLGPEAVTQYAVPEKLFSLVTVIVLMAINPLWPAYGEAIERGDRAWVIRTLRRSIIGTLLFSTFACAALVAFGPWLLMQWVGSLVQPSLMLLVSFAAWRIVESLGSCVSVFLNGTGHIRIQATVAIPMAAVALLLKLYLAPLIGTSGILISTTIAWLVCAGIPLLLYIRALPYFRLSTTDRSS